jgi:hypothetical protein
MLNENNLGINLCSLNNKTLEKFTNTVTVPLYILLNGYNNVSDSGIVMDLNDKVEPGIDSNLILDAIIKDIKMVDPSKFYRYDITQQQITNLNNKINNYLSCNIK